MNSRTTPLPGRIDARKHQGNARTHARTHAAPLGRAEGCRTHARTHTRTHARSSGHVKLQAQPVHDRAVWMVALLRRLVNQAVHGAGEQLALHEQRVRGVGREDLELVADDVVVIAAVSQL
eukprot:CAMPEP_0204511254 /NCGR_PEP_ID=MMETSP0661-20131031/330_1 /ASSEMBLY_ACC=CAM_ASM_000606 /TAXON_ID=109239 /ORGANISM="Alexandrium margalefi, Strain AMGDE01CS-322" /LENGTH=120 /DNA_ID=CAMNT_0051516331 /DNA_START=162 /DNA_END=520 /DNA_ORIENTATION=+